MIPSKPLAPHGTYARYIGRPAGNLPGCRCDPCIKEGRRYYMRRDFLAATGRPLTVDAAATRKHLQALMEAGAGWNQLVAVSGSSASTIHAILSGKQPTVRRSTEQKFLKIRHAQVVPDTWSVPSTGTVRRLRALAAIGHPAARLAADAGLSESLIIALLAGNLTMVRPQTRDAIAAVFKRLAMAPGTGKGVAARAAQKGWAPPLAWDDDMDDPHAVPVAAAIRKIRHTEPGLRPRKDAA